MVGVLFIRQAWSESVTIEINQVGGSRASIDSKPPALTFDRSGVRTRLKIAFEDALRNLLTINTVPLDASRYNRSGQVVGSKFIRAGGGYDQPWTRDASINSWNAASLIEPDVASDTLFAVTAPDENGLLCVQKDNQWWDKVIWVVGAWNHYKVTGNRKFLAIAYEVSARLLREMRRTHFNAAFGLFEGPSFFNDGIAGYPSPPADPMDGGSSFVLDHPGAEHLMALSTNCLYVGSYQAASAMAKELGKAEPEWERSATSLRISINKHLWVPRQRQYGYFVDQQGRVDPSQEGCGLAFAILFGVARGSRASDICSKSHIEPSGIVDIYPSFPRYSPERPGRHNVVVWPMVQGMWARAGAKLRNVSALKSQTEDLARLEENSGGHFFEIYDSVSGKPNGGWQNGRQWGSAPDQTWSATAYLSMIFEGLFGMRFEANALRFEPLVPEDWGGATLTGIRYRGSILDIHLKGTGTRVKALLLDGRNVRAVPAVLTGRHEIDIEVE